MEGTFSTPAEPLTLEELTKVYEHLQRWNAVEMWVSPDFWEELVIKMAQAECEKEPSEALMFYGKLRALRGVIVHKSRFLPEGIPAFVKWRKGDQTTILPLGEFPKENA